MRSSTRIRLTRLVAVRLAGFVVAVFSVGSLAAPAADAAVPTQLSGGGFHTCAVMAGGSVRCWGWNIFGQLGDGSNAARLVPVEVHGIDGASQVSGGAMHSCVLMADGQIKCWGYNEFGELGDGTTMTSNLPVSTIGIESATAVVAGGYHTCALTRAGSVMCWGYNEDGELGDGTRNWSLTPVAASPLSGATQLGVGLYHSCALISGGSVKCWGKNDQGQLGDASTSNRLSPGPVSGISGATQITSGDYHSCAIVAGGAVKCWGRNDHGQLGNQSTTSSTVPVSVFGITGASQISGGSLHTCALLAGGAVKCWGYNGHGELGTGSDSQSLVPATVLGITGAVQIATGEYHSCARFPGGTVKCWGNGGEGELGDGAARWTNTPVQTLGMPSTLDPPQFVPSTPAFTKLRTAAIAFSGVARSSFECSTDGAAFNPCLSPLRLAGLTDGDHTVAVRQTDGIYTSPPATFAWTVDNVAPAAPTFATAPASLVNLNSASFSISAESGASITCRLDSGPVSPCSSSPSFGPLADGRHTLTVQQTDRAGNRGPAATYAWVVDTVPPKRPLITGGPARLTNQQVATFTIANRDAANLTCSMDGGSFAACPPAAGLKAIAEGPHSLTARATDAAGNSADATWAWSVDLTPPELIGNATDSKSKTRTQTTYQLSASEDTAKIEWSSAVAAPAPDARNVAANTSAFGARVVFRTFATIRWLRLQDRAGNWSQWLAG